MTYRGRVSGGVVVPEEEVSLPDGTSVSVEVAETVKQAEPSPVPGSVIGPTSYLIPPEVSDPEEQRRALQAVVESMRRNPIPANAPRRFTREELHERR